MVRQGFKVSKGKVKTETIQNRQSDMAIEIEDHASPKKGANRRGADEQNDSSQSTSIGSTERGRKQGMLPRDHTMTKEQLLHKVHTQMYCCLEFIGNSHDKLGNGFPSLAYIFKKTGSVTLERIKKALLKRATQKYSRKLFSIYRYRVANF